jgi:hypothetical protein
VTSPAARLNGARTFILAALAIVWFAEMALWGVRPLSEMWTGFWGIVAPEDPQLARALYLTHAFEAAAKGALGVLAVYALRSRNPFVRSALFVSMALVPPLNVVFQFRAQGFPLRPTVIGATLSVILWETFFLFKDGTEQPSQKMDGVTRARAPLSDWFQYAWFAANAIVLTFAAALFLFAPDTGLRLAFPCFSGPDDAARAGPSALTLSAMAIGTHLTAIASATWIATAHSRNQASVRRAVAAANTLHAALLCMLPLLQLTLGEERRCATSSLLIYSIPLLGGWLVYAALSSHTTLTARLHLAHPIDR